MADYIQGDSPLRFPEEGVEWHEVVGDSAGILVTADDLINATLTYTYDGNTITYNYDVAVGTWTGDIGQSSSDGPGGGYWEETGNVLSPINISRDVAVGGKSPGTSVYLEASGNVTCTKVTSVVYGLESLPSLPV